MTDQDKVKTRKRTPSLKDQKPDFPEVCCGVCTFSHMEENQLLCYGLPPVMILDAGGEQLIIRGMPIEATDNPCSYFKPKVHS